MLIAAAILCGFLLDALLGDPAWLPHPVVLMGKAISALEKRLRSWFPKTPDGEKKAGRVLAVTLPLGTLLISGGLCVGLMLLHPVLGFLLQTFWCWQALAMKGLAVESGNVYRALTTASLPEARKAVARIVGRDTAALTEQGVTRAAVETVAENASDGVIAPLIYLALAGPVGGMMYKAANTMDSMVGYKNQRYLYFGRPAARLDDLLNFLPARIAGGLMCLAAGFAGFNSRRALYCFRRDRKKHASPNSAHTEAAAAGALGLRLAGPAVYFGQVVEKPWLNQEGRESEPGDILRANRLMYAAAFLALMLFCGVPLLILLRPW